MKDLAGLMKKAQEMQSRMGDMQAQLDDLEITGTSGAGLVSITLSGKGNLKNLDIDKSLMKPDEKEILEDLIIAAHNDAKAKSEKTVADKMKEAMGDIPMPPGFNLGM
jgi:DNA-binding YbaB/EbfC family protein